MFRRGRPRRRMSMRAPIVTKKRQFNFITSYVGGLANDITTLYTGLDTDQLEGSVGVHLGKKVYSVDVSVNFITSSPSEGNDYSWMLVHLRQDQVVGTLFGTPASSWSTIGNSPGKNQVIKSYMGVHGTEDSSSVKYNVHIKIPKMWHRIREGDSLQLVYNGDAAGTLNIGFRFKTYS